MLEAIHTEGESNGRKIFAECTGQSIVTTAACYFKSEVAYVSSKENSGVIIETADFPEINRKVLGKVETLEDRVNLFKVIQRLD